MHEVRTKVIHYAGSRQAVENTIDRLSAESASDRLYRDLALHRLKRVTASPSVVRHKQQLVRVLDQLDVTETIEVVRVKIFGRSRVMYVLARDKTVLGWFEADGPADAG